MMDMLWLDTSHWELVKRQAIIHVTWKPRIKGNGKYSRPGLASGGTLTAWRTLRFERAVLEGRIDLMPPPKRRERSGLGIV